MERKAILFAVVVVIVVAAVYLAFPAVFNFRAGVKESPKPQVIITEFFLQLDPATSTLSWSAGAYQGSLNFRFGEIGRNKEGKVVGTFAVDMASLKSNDPEVETRLKGKEFFEAERFTNAELAVTGLNYFGPSFNAAGEQVESYDLTGELTVKGVTQSIKVPLTISMLGDKVVATGEFTVRREEFLLGPRDPQLPNEAKIMVKLVSKEAISAGEQ